MFLSCYIENPVSPVRLERELIDINVHVILEGIKELRSLSFLAADDVTLATTSLAPLHRHTCT